VLRVGAVKDVVDTRVQFAKRPELHFGVQVEDAPSGRFAGIKTTVKHRVVFDAVCRSDQRRLAPASQVLPA
jgi:hypothetical protein